MENNFIFISTLGTSSRMGVISCLNKGEPVDVLVEYDKKTNRVNVYLNDNGSKGAKVGAVIAENDTKFAHFQKMEPAINEVISAEKFIEDYGENTVEATVIIAANTTIVKARLNNVTANKKVVVEKAPEPKMEEIDLSSFGENAPLVKQRLDYVDKLSLSTKVKHNMKKQIAAWISSHTTICPFEPRFINYDNKVETAIKNLLIGRHIAMIGPKGVGKNVLASHLANYLNLGIYDSSMSSETTKEDLVGGKTINDNGGICFEVSNLVMAMQEPNLIVLDEANLARAAVIGILHSTLDERGYIEIPAYGKVKMHPQCRFVITLNDGDGYEGTRPLNEAFKDRFHEMHFKASPDHMSKVFAQECNLSENDANELAKLYKLLFNSVYSNDENCIPDEYLSQRKFIAAGRLYATGFAETIKEAFEEEVVNTIGDPEVAETLRHLVLVNYK